MTAADDSSVRTTSTNRMQYHPLSRSVQALPTAATAAAQVGVPPLVTSSSAGTVDVSGHLDTYLPARQQHRAADICECLGGHVGLLALGSRRVH